MKRLFPNVILVTFFLVISAMIAGAQDFTVVSSSWTPFVYEENGKITGLGTEIVNAVLGKAGIKPEITLYPWKRAMKIAQQSENVLIYPIVRIRERESDFTWVAPVFSVKMCLYKLKNRTDIRINSLEDAKKYTIGVLREAAMHQMLRGEGFRDGKQLQETDSNAKSVFLLFKKRMDMIAENPIVMTYEAKKMGLPLDEVEEVFLLFEHEAYMAFGKKNSGKSGSIERLETAFEQLKTDGTIDTILDKYK